MRENQNGKFEKTDENIIRLRYIYIRVITLEINSILEEICLLGCASDPIKLIFYTTN